MTSISVVVETFNAIPESAIDLRQVLDRLCAQTCAHEILEIIVVVDSRDVQLFRSLEDDYPTVRLVSVENTTYYSMKVHGINAAHGQIIALLDCDCLPTEHWAEAIITSIDDGADMVVGKTQYADTAWYSRPFNFFSFGHIHNDDRGDANAFNPNNVAFTRQIVQSRIFVDDPRRRRSCAANVLMARIKQLGFKPVYNPSQKVTHNNYGLAYHLSNRIRSGHEAVRFCQIDDDGVLAEKKYERLGLLAPFVFALRRLIHDFRCLTTTRHDCTLAWYETPFYAGLCVVIRMIEIVPGIVTVLKPGYFHDKYGW